MQSLIKPILFLLLTVLFFACKKDHGVLGLEVQPAYDLLEADITESPPVTMYSEKVDSVISYQGDYKYLGSNQDPTFGRTDVGMYLSASLYTSNVNFGSEAVLTSAEIVLEISGTEYMGEASTPLSYSVFPVDSTLSRDRYYFTANNRLYAADSIVGKYNGIYSLLEGRPVLRIPLDSFYASSILNNSQYLIDNTTFQEKYKGYYISAEKTNLNPGSSPGIISLFNMSSTSISGLYLYYKSTPASAAIQSFRFTFYGDNVVRFNTVKYQPNQGGNYMLTAQLGGDTLKGNQNTFIKGMGGTSIYVNIPGLEHHKDSPYVAVNRAEVIFNIDNNYLPTFGKYNPPPVLALIPLDSIGRESLGGHSYNVNNLSVYNGKLDVVNNRYVFNIARFVQLVLNGNRKCYGFKLVVADPALSLIFYRDIYINRTAFYGLNNDVMKPKCNLYYVKLKDD